MAAPSVEYEWCIEYLSYDPEIADPDEPAIIGLDFSDDLYNFGDTALIDAILDQKLCRLCLCVKIGADGYGDRAWAYVENGKLDVFLRDAHGEAVRKVPLTKMLDFMKRVKGLVPQKK
jgi:hypothetical protein